jgi:hypothetical protein
MANDKRENTSCLGSLLIGNYSVSTVTVYNMVRFFIIILFILIKKFPLHLQEINDKLSNT